MYCIYRNQMYLPLTSASMVRAASGWSQTVIQAKHGLTTPGLLPVPSSRPDCPGFAILSLSACASLCSSDRIRVLTLSVFLLVSIGSWQLLPRTSWRNSPLPAHRPEPRRICVCFHKTATRISRFLSDGSCM